MKTRISSLPVLLFLAAGLIHALAAPIVPHSAHVDVQVRFGNLPGGEISAVLKNASRAAFSGSTATVSPPLSFDASRVLLADRPGSPNLDDELIVEAAPLGTDPGFIYSVGLDLYLPDLYNPKRQSTEPLHEGETASVEFNDCPAMLDVRFVNSPGGPSVRVERAQLECFEAGIPDSRHALAFIGSETGHKLVVHSGVPLHLVAVSRVATSTPGEWIDLFREVYTTTPLGCDEVRVAEVVVPPFDALGRITGFVEMARERANAHDLSDTPIYSISTVMAAAGFGGDQFWDSGRYTLVPLRPDLPALPSGSSGSVGEFLLRNLLASEDFGPSFGTLPYTVHGQMQFGTGRGANFFRTPWLFGSSRVLVPRGGTVDVGDMFRMKPSYVRGQVVLEGPAEVGGFRSPLRHLRTASDRGAPGESIKLYSSVESLGLNEVAPGATEPAYQGVGATELDGAFSGSQFSGAYRLILAGLRGQPSLWDSPRLHLYFNSADSGDPLILGKLLITNRPSSKIAAKPFGEAIRDQRYCFGYLEMMVQAPAGTEFASFQPAISVEGDGPDYHVQTDAGEDYVGDDRHPLPFLGQSTTAREGIVRLMLPAGTYTLTPSARLVAADGTVTRLTMASVINTIVCRAIMTNRLCLSVSISPPPECAGEGTARITGSVNSCTNNVTKLVWDQRDNLEHVICLDCGANPTFAFDLPVAGPCRDYPFTVTAYDADGRPASAQAILPADRTPPMFRCPSNLVFQSAGTNGAVVDFPVIVTDNCDTNPVVSCTPPSGSFFRLGDTTVQCVAYDRCQNQATCEFTVTVEGTNACVPPPPSAWNVRGNVADRAGRPLPSVRVSMASLDGPASFSTVTDDSGNYALTGAAGEKYRVSAGGAAFVSWPASLDAGPLDRDVVVDFTLLSPFENWQRTHWGDAPPPEAASGADPDGDLRENLMEYATGTDPRVPDAPRGLRVAFSGGASPRITVELELSPEATDIVAGLQAKPLPLLGIGSWRDALRYYPAGRNGASAPERRWILPLVTPAASRDLPAPRLGVAVDLPPLAEALVFRMSVCFLTACGEPAMPSAASLPSNGDSLRIGFMNVQFMDQAAMFLGSILGDFHDCCGGCDRGGDIARRVIAGDYDVIALAEVWVDGGGIISKVIQGLVGGTLEEKVREWARVNLPAGTTEEEIAKREEDIVKLIERWRCVLGPSSNNSKARLIELLGRAGYIHRVEKLDAFGNLQDSGLMLFSRFPFERLPAETRAASARYIHPAPGIDIDPFGFGVRAVNGEANWNSEVAFIEYPYEHCSGYECQSAKGAGLVRIRNPHTGLVYNVIFTHLQASDGTDDKTARVGQLGEIKEMIDTVLGGGLVQNEPVLILGDFNIKGSLTPREEWEKYFQPGTRLEHGGFFNNTVADAWERQVATVGDAHSSPLPDIAPVPVNFRDPGLTGNADVGGNARYDYLLANDPRLVSINATQHVSVQHLAMAYDLMGDPTTNRSAFGFEGTRILSDHFGLVADINIREDQCNPPLALVEKDLQHDDPRGHAYPGILRRPGSMQWWRFDAPGTYSFGLAPNGRATTNDLEYMVFTSRNLSRPLHPVRSNPRILQSDADCRQVIAYTFHTDDAPIYVRVRHVRRSETASFDLVARRHQCVSEEDSCELHPNLPPTEVKPLPITVTDRPRWYRLQTECPTSGRRQAIAFETQSAGAPPGLHHVVSLQTANLAGELVEVVEPVAGNDPIQLLNPEFSAGGKVVYAIVAPFLDTPREPFFVRWTNNLTVFDPHSIRNDVPLDNDIIWDNQDDEFMRITLSLTAPDDTPPWSHSVPLSGLFLDFNEGHSRGVGLDIFPTVRFLPDEVFVITFDEDDPGLLEDDDTMTATPPALGAGEPGADADGVIQVVQEGRPGLLSGRGRYKIYGLKRHFGINLSPACPHP